MANDECTAGDVRHWTEDEWQDDPADNINLNENEDIENLEVNFPNVNDWDGQIPSFEDQEAVDNLIFVTKSQMYCEQSFTRKQNKKLPL